MDKFETIDNVIDFHSEQKSSAREQEIQRLQKLLSESLQDDIDRAIKLLLANGYVVTKKSK